MTIEMSSTAEQILELAHGQRHVKTPEGAKFYGLPIGSIITRAEIEAKHAEAAAKGITPPKGGLSSGDASATIADAKAQGLETADSVEHAASKAVSDPAYEAAVAAEPDFHLKLLKPTISGPEKFSVGDGNFSAPLGSKLYKLQATDALAFVVTPDGKIHSFVSAGEVPIPEGDVQDDLTNDLANGLQPNSAYVEDKFSATASSYGIGNLQPGDKLTNKEGEPQFTKQADGTFTHDQLGTTHQEKDLSDAYKEGALVPQKNSKDAANSAAFEGAKADDFSKMSHSEAVAAIEKLPAGTKVTAGGETLTKNDGDDFWTLDSNPSSNKLKAESVAYLKSDLKVVGTKDEPAPEAPEDKPEAPSTSDAPITGPDDQAKIDNAETMFGTDSPQHKAAKEKFGAKPVEETAPADETKPAPTVEPKPGEAKTPDAPKSTPKTTAEKPKSTEMPTTFGKATEDADLKGHAFQVGDDVPAHALSKLGTGTVLTHHYTPSSGSGTKAPDLNYEKVSTNHWISEKGVGKSDQEMANMVQFSKADAFRFAGHSEFYDKASQKDLSDYARPEGVPESAHETTPLQLSLEPEGAVLYRGQSAYPNKGYDVDHFTKQSNGTWKDSYLGKEWKDSALLASSDDDTKLWVDASGKKPPKVTETALSPEPEAPEIPKGSKVVTDFSEVNHNNVLLLDDGKGEPKTLLWNDSTKKWDVGNGPKNPLITEGVLKSHAEQGNLFLAPNQPEAAKKTLQPGDKLTSVQDMLDAETGTMLHYTKADGSVTPYVKTATGNWLLPSGNEHPSEKFAKSIKYGSFTYASGPKESIPDDAPKVEAPVSPNNPEVATPFDYKSGDKITKLGHLGEMQPGTVLYSHEPTVNEGTGLVITKQDDGTWQDHFGDTVPFAELGDDITKQRLFFTSSPEAKYPVSTTPEITFTPGGKAYSTADLKEALDSLQAHPAPQVKYGLKAVPDNPVAHPDNLPGIQAQAKEEFPDLAPKNAVINLLKSKLGMDTTPVKVAKDVAEGPTIHFGDAEPEQTPTGLTGGDIAESDVEKAVSILENFQGKNFLSELKKKDNPVGYLSDNHLVGFDKDKAVKKQKMIALLKAKLDQSAANKDAEPDVTPDEPSVPEESPVAEPEAPFAPAVGDTIDKENIAKYEVGTTLSTANGSEWTKDGENSWSTPGGLHTTDEAWQASKFPQTLKSLPGEEAPHADEKPLDEEVDTPVEELTPEPSPLTEEPHEEIPTVSADDLAAASVGSQVNTAAPGYKSFILTKQDGGKWTDPDGAEYSSSLLASFSNVRLLPQKNADEAPEGLHVGSPISSTDMDALDTGTQIKTIHGFDYTKKINGNWESDTGTEFSSSTFSGLSSTITFLPEDEPSPTPTVSLSTDDIADQPIGAVIEVGKENGSVKYLLTKVGPDAWRDDKGQDKIWPESAITKTMEGPTVYAHQISKPNDLPDYATTNTALKANSSELGDTSDPVDVTSDDIANATAGTVVQGEPMYYGQSGNAFFTKQAGGQWLTTAEGGYTTSTSSSALKKWADEGKVKSVPNPTENATGLMPGKYVSSKNGVKGSAYMIVKTDGTGVYVASTGTTTPLSTLKIKKNYEAGMASYAGIPDTIPELTPKQKKEASTVKKIKPQIDGDVELNDGTYYLGNASGQATKVYVVKDGNVLVYPDQWSKDHDAETVKVVPLNKIKTAYFTGKVLDGDGNSIVPEGYMGQVFVQNQPTTIANMVQLKKAIEDGKLDNFYNNGTQNTLSQLGYPTNIYKMDVALKADHPDWETRPYNLQYTIDPENQYNVAAKQKLLDTIAPFLENVDTSTPQDNPASKFFNWTAEGEAQMPAALVNAPQAYYTPAAETNAYINSVSDLFGGKSVMMPVTLDKYDKAQWIMAFQQGDFQKMYQLEVAEAANKGKVHPEGYNHPGYPGNSETHKIVWGAAVSGETVTGKEVPGEWSDVPVDSWSAPEIDNYLIAAHMQNPTYLSLSEKRQWVQGHKNTHNKKDVDTLSVQAMNRKEAGNAPLSEPPVWADDIVPAKVYDSLFDDTKFPTSQQWSMSGHGVATAWAKDNLESNPEFKQQVHDYFKAQYGYSDDDLKDLDPSTESSYAITSVVGSYFDGKKAEYEAELLKPVYTKVKKLGGSHDVFLMKDQFDRQYVWKPSPPGGEWRSETELGALKLAKKFGFHAPVAQTMELNGEHGLMQSFIPNNGTTAMIGQDWNKLSSKQLGEMSQEHVLDWILDNDDTHSDNLLLGPNDNIASVDKGRAFKAYGIWRGLDLGTSPGTGPNTNAQVAYQQMYAKAASGEIPQEKMDQAYFAAMKAANRIQKTSDADVEALVREATKNRTKWAKDAYYSNPEWAQEPAPANQDELVASVLERKSIMPEEIKEMWQQIYAKAGWELPQKPDKALGENQNSGWDEPDVVDSAKAAKVWGSAALHSSSSVVNGHSLLWTEKTQDGNDQVLGTLKLGPAAQKKALAFLKPLAKDNTGMSEATIGSFPATFMWKQTLSKHAKDISNNAIDKDFDPTSESEYNDLKKNLNDDTEAWSPDLQPGENGFVKFPSGNSVSPDGILQYKQMLDHYQGHVAKIDAAKATGTTTQKGDITLFTPTALAPTTPSYSKDGVTYSKLNNGTWLKSTNDAVSLENPPTEAINGSDGWVVNSQDDSQNVGGALVAKVKATGFGGTLDWGGEKTQADDFGPNGTPGHAFETTLPTGEKIIFQNTNDTGTVQTQQGQVSFKLNPGEEEAGLQRVQEHLANYGVDMAGADEDSAETVYWRNMFQRVLDSKGGGEKINAARKALTDKRSEYGTTSNLNDLDNTVGLLEAIGANMTPAEERIFYHDLANSTYGEDKVAAWIAADKHLPKYNHMNLDNVEQNTGKPYFDRIDVDKEKLAKTQTLLAIGNNGKDNSLLNYVKSGGMVSTEERLRLLGTWKKGASSAEDQATGGGSNVFTRIAGPGKLSEKSGSLYGEHVAYWNPKVMAQAGTYSYDGDSYGNTSYLQSKNQLDPLKSLAENHDTDNETMIPNNLSIYDALEIMVFEDAQKRDQAIQEMKKRGLDILRGLPIEERLIMRSQLNATLKKVKAEMLNHVDD